ncbi:MAG: M28 family peptidase [Flavobacteriales bacterium]
MATHYAATITEQDLRTYLTVLASDAYEGRETGMKGQKMAAAYIQEHFQAFGIPPVPNAEQRGMMNGYQQSFPLVLSYPGGITLAAAGRSFGFPQDYFYFNEKLRGALEVPQITFVGDGQHVPKDARFAEVALMLLPSGLVSGDGAVPSGTLHGLIQQRTAVAAAHGARVLLIASPEEPAMAQAFAHYINGPRMRLARAEKEEEKPQLQTIIISKPMAEVLLQQAGWTWRKALRKQTKAPVDLECPMQLAYVPKQQELTGENVLGYIEGSDKKGELVVVTAHFDHIGKDGDEVYNGADDDGSGTVAVLELAQAFAKAKAEGHGPRRSMLFMTVSGEEKGLLGSEWYSEHPVFPLDSTVADLNIDMIGRVDSAHATTAPYVYVIGSRMLSSELGDINEAQNQRHVGLQLDHTFDAPDDPNRFYYRSDHYNFAKHGIPVIFYFSGVHADYHGPYDEVDRIRFDLLRQRALLVFHTAWELANLGHRITVDKDRSR